MDCKQETPFTLFSEDDYAFSCDAGYPSDLAGFVKVFAEEDPSNPPVAWMVGRAQDLKWERCRDESIAAGRLIEKTPSGWVALGAEKQEESALDRAVKHLSELRKVDPSPADVAMTDRDQRPHASPEPVRFDPFKGFRVGSNHIWQVGEERADHASPFGIFRSPDCSSDPDHLNASRHQLAVHKG